MLKINKRPDLDVQNVNFWFISKYFDKFENAFFLKDTQLKLNMFPGLFWLDRKRASVMFSRAHCILSPRCRRVWNVLKFWRCHPSRLRCSPDTDISFFVGLRCSATSIKGRIHISFQMSRVSIHPSVVSSHHLLIFSSSRREQERILHNLAIQVKSLTPSKMFFWSRAFFTDFCTNKYTICSVASASLFFSESTNHQRQFPT